MNIALLLPGFSSSEADWCIPAVLNLVRGLTRSNEVHVFALRYPYRRCTYEVYGATVHALGGARRRHFGRLALLGQALRALLREHRHAPFDVLHGLWADEAGFLAATAGRLLGVPSVVSVMGGELVGFADIGYGSLLSPINRRLVHSALGKAGAVTVGSSYLHGLAGPHVPPHRLHRLPLGVDTTLFQPQPDPGDSSPLAGGKTKLLHVASLVPVKNQAMLLSVLSKVAGELPEAHLHLVGEGPLRAELETQAAACGVGRRATFHGSVPHDRLPAYFRAADLCVLTSRHEGQELVTLEAAACGRTTVGTAVGLVPDLVPATRAVPVGDAPGLSEAIIHLLQRPRRLAEMGCAARGRVEKDYSLKVTVNRLQALYAETR
ncbi:MAG: glycosyltransferase [Acidobacteriota bacterium]